MEFKLTDDELYFLAGKRADDGEPLDATYVLATVAETAVEAQKKLVKWNSQFCVEHVKYRWQWLTHGTCPDCQQVLRQALGMEAADDVEA